jgi:hypothetical protein
MVVALTLACRLRSRDARSGRGGEGGGAARGGPNIAEVLPLLLVPNTVLLCL